MASFSNPPEGFEQIDAERAPIGEGKMALQIDPARIDAFVKGIAGVTVRAVFAGQRPTVAMATEVMTIMTAVAITIRNMPRDHDERWAELTAAAWEASGRDSMKGFIMPRPPEPTPEA